MNKETLIEINDLDNPFEREKLESLPNDILVELLIRHIKREIKVINYTNWNYNHYRLSKVFKDKILEILGDKENE